MSEEVVRTVIAVNNSCVEHLHNGNLISTLSELHEAMKLLKQGVTIVDPTSRSSHHEGVLSSIQVPVLPRSNHVVTNDHYNRSSTLVVRMQFQREESFTDRTNLTDVPTSTTPIVACNRLLVIVAVDQDVARIPRPEQHHQTDNSGDAVSTEDLHLLSVALLYNMGLLCQQIASFCHNQDTRRSAATMCHASKIYELLIQLCSHGNIWMTPPPTTPVDANHHRCFLRMIQMIAYNNYAKICYKLGNYTMYQYCMNVLQYQLIFLLSWNTNPTNDNRASNEQDILTELQLNALVAKLLPVPTLAPAA
jgi:hypothetical protein